MSDAIAVLIVIVVAFVPLALFAHLCAWIRRRHPGSLADRIRAAIADEDFQ